MAFLAIALLVRLSYWHTTMSVEESWEAFVPGRGAPPGTSAPLMLPSCTCSSLVDCDGRGTDFLSREHDQTALWLRLTALQMSHTGPTPRRRPRGIRGYPWRTCSAQGYRGRRARTRRLAQAAVQVVTPQVPRHKVPPAPQR